MMYQVPATTTSNTLATTSRFTPSLFTDFVRFVDGSQKTTKTYVNNLKQFAVWTRYQNVEQPIREDVLSYRNWLTTEHQAIEYANTEMGWKYRLDASGNPVIVTCKPATVRLYMQSVKQFFKWTATNNLYPNIAEQIKTPKVRNDIHKKDALTPSEVLIVEQSIASKATEKTTQQENQTKDTKGRIQRSTEQGKRMYAIYLLAVNAGLRTVEISRANVKDLECKGGQAYLYVWGKGHSEADQKKPINREVYKAIKDYLASRTDRPTGTSPLFVATGNRAHGKRIAPTTISTMLKQALVGAGFESERLTAHSLRHTAGTSVQSLTNNLYATQNYMRHTSPTTTEIYLHVETEKQDAEIADQLYSLYHRGVAKSASAQSNQEKSMESIFDGLTDEQREMLIKYAQGR